MMKPILYTAILIVFAACADPLFGQVLRAPDFKTPPGVSEAEVGKMVAAIDQRLTEYKKVGSLLNKKTGTIDRESINAFKTLFELDAKVYNDMQEFPEDALYELDGYINLARNYFNQEGIPFAVSDVTLKSVKPYDEESVCTVSLMKSTDKYYNSNADVIRESRTIELEFDFIVRRNSSSLPKIRTIRGKSKAPPAAYVSMIGVDLRGGLHQLGYTLSPDFKKFREQGDLSAKSSVGFQGGFVWYSNFWAPTKSTRKNLFATAGINIAYSQIESELTDYWLKESFVATVKTSAGVIYDSLYTQPQKINTVEKLKTTTLQIPLGISYRLLKKATSALQFDLTYVPAIALTKKIEVSGSGVYDLYGNVNNIDYYSYLKDKADSDPASSIITFGNIRDYGEQSIRDNWKPKTSLSHQVGASLTFFKDFVSDSPTFGLALGLDAVWGLTPFLPNSELQTPLYKEVHSGADKNNPQTSVYGSYLQNLALRKLGLRVVIFRKTIKKP